MDRESAYENESLKHSQNNLYQFYDKYASVMYGSILHLVADKKMAEAIFADAFLELSSHHAIGNIPKKNMMWLLRFTYCFTLKKLKVYNIEPTPNGGVTNRLIIDWLCTDCDSMESLMVATGFNRQQIQEELHIHILKLRLGQAAGGASNNHLA